MYNENGGLSLLKKNNNNCKVLHSNLSSSCLSSSRHPITGAACQTLPAQNYNVTLLSNTERLSRPFTGELPRQVGSRHCSDDVSTSLSLLASFPIVLSVCDSSIFVFIIGKEPAGVDSRVQVKLQCANTMSYSCAASEMLIYVLYFYWGEQWEPQIEEEKVGTNLDVFIWII